MKRKLSALLAASMVVSLAGVLPAQAAEADTATQGNGLSWDMAEEILRLVMETGGAGRDDMTVLVTGIWRK